MRLFADDCALYREIKSQEDCRILQRDLDSLQNWEKTWLMQFHPLKCQVMNATNKKEKIHFAYNIHGQVLAVESTVKYLGVNINEKLSWNNHIQQVTKKAHNTLNFLQRNTANCPRATKILCYSTLVRPIVEYCSVVWDPHTKTNIDAVEMVQRRAARYVMRDFRRTSSVAEMLKNLQWNTLQQRRLQAKATLMFKIWKDLVALRKPPTSLNETSTRGNIVKLQVPYCRTDIHKASFYPSAIYLWNEIPLRTTALSLEQFKLFLSELLLKP